MGLQKSEVRLQIERASGYRLLAYRFWLLAYRYPRKGTPKTVEPPLEGYFPKEPKMLSHLTNTGVFGFCLCCKKVLAQDSKLFSIQVIRDWDQTIEGYLHRLRCFGEWRRSHPSGFTYK
jgi:hypothetical protein